MTVIRAAGQESELVPPAMTPIDREPRVVLADRGDALVPHLSRALRDRYDVVAGVGAQLNPVERLVVGGITFRPARRYWVERFFKSNLAVWLRSRRAQRGVRAVPLSFDVVFQTHALFEVTDPRTVLYVDCTHHQSMDSWPDWNPLRGRALRTWLARERRQYHSAAHVFAFCQETRTSLICDYGLAPEQVTVVGAGVNFEDLPALHDAADRPSDRPPTVLFVGNDFERKGGRELLAAFELVRQAVPGAQLRIVGTPHEIAPQPGVEVLGRVHDRDAMSRLYAEADVFCLPSFFDPFPLAVLEAMSHGLPTVVTRTCGVPEVVLDDETGLLVDLDDAMVASLATALTALLTDPDRAARMGLAGRRRVEQRFLWSHVVDRMSDVLGAMSHRSTRHLTTSSVHSTRTRGARS